MRCFKFVCSQHRRTPRLSVEMIRRNTLLPEVGPVGPLGLDGAHQNKFQCPPMVGV